MHPDSNQITFEKNCKDYDSYAVQQKNADCTRIIAALGYRMQIKGGEFERRWK